MFNDCVSNLSITSVQADSIITNITGDSVREDKSWLATLRCLLYSRISKDEMFHFLVSIFDMPDYSFTAETSADYIRRRYFVPGNNRIMMLRARSESWASNEAMRLMTDKDKGFKDMKYLPDVSTFISHYFKCKVFINEENKSAFIMVVDRRMASQHLIQSLIPRLIPAFFRDKPITEDELNLLSTLRNSVASDYIREAEKFWKSLNLDDEIIKASVIRVMKHARDVEIESYKNEIENCMARMQHLMSQYAEYCRTKDDFVTRLMGAECRAQNEANDPEFADYLIHNKDSVFVVKATDFGIELEINSYISNYDPDMFEAMVSNENSYLHYLSISSSDERLNNDKIRNDFLLELFGCNPAVKIKTCGYYQLDVRGSVNSISGREYSAKCEGRIPNPHLQRHSCLGDHRRYIAECLSAGNKIGAVEQCRASAASINVGESVTFNPFIIELLSEQRYKYFELPDGTSANASEALDWIVENKWGGSVE